MACGDLHRRAVGSAGGGVAAAAEDGTEATGSAAAHRRDLVAGSHGFAVKGDVPERYGPCQTAYTLFRRWQIDGTWARVLKKLQVRADATEHIDHVLADRAYFSRQIREYLRRRQIQHTIPEKRDQAGRRLRPGFGGWAARPGSTARCTSAETGPSAG